MISMLETIYQSGTRENMCLNVHLFWQTVVRFATDNFPTPSPSLRSVPSSPPALLLRRHNLEGAAVLLRRGADRALSRHLAPSAAPTASAFSAVRVCTLATRRAQRRIHLALLGERAATQKLFGKVAAVERVGDGVHGFGDDVEFIGEREESLDKVFDCRSVGHQFQSTLHLHATATYLECPWTTPAGAQPRPTS